MTRKSIAWTVGMALAAALFAGCAGDAPLEPGTAPEAQVELSRRAEALGFEMVAVDEAPTPRPLGSQTADPENASDEAPAVCSCETEECFEAWVDEYFGCNVCVVVSCGDGYSPHMCHACPAGGDDPLSLQERGRVPLDREATQQ